MRIALVGCGAVTQAVYVPLLSRRRDLFEVSAVCDLSRTLADAVGDRLGAAGRYTSVDDLLAMRRLRGRRRAGLGLARRDRQEGPGRRVRRALREAARADQGRGGRAAGRAADGRLHEAVRPRRTPGRGGAGRARRPRGDPRGRGHRAAPERGVAARLRQPDPGTRRGPGPARLPAGGRARTGVAGARRGGPRTGQEPVRGGAGLHLPRPVAPAPLHRLTPGDLVRRDVGFGPRLHRDLGAAAGPGQVLPALALSGGLSRLPRDRGDPPRSRLPRTGLPLAVPDERADHADRGVRRGEQGTLARGD